VRSASEPSGNLAPRLDHEGHKLPWVRIHFITSFGRNKRRAGHGERVVVCSRIVNSGSSHHIRRRAIAAVTVRPPHGAGGASRRAGVTGARTTAGPGGANRTAAIGNDGVNVRHVRRQLTRPRRARVSAQRNATKILANECAIGRAAMPHSG
jgi:hypothetical protein